MALSCLFAASLMLAVGMPPSSAQAQNLPILFVHGNGDSAALWHTTVWRFESNGYDPALLHAVDLPSPAAPADDRVDEPNRSTTTDQRDDLAAAVQRVLHATGQDQVVLIGSSRGGTAIRNYIKNGSGHTTVALAILSGTPNHGAFRSSDAPGSEFNQLGEFLAALNAGTEVHPDVPFVTLRSDSNDKYAQPAALTQPNGEAFGSGYDSPTLRGALNLVVNGLDHREIAFHPRAFHEIYRAVTGRPPATLAVVPRPRVTVSGLVSGFANGDATNLPVARASVTVYEVDPHTGARLGAQVLRTTTGPDGRWGPLSGTPTAYYEFVVTADGYPTTHIYRTPFPRSTDLVRIRLAPLPDGFADAPAIVTMTRPRGYFGHGRDTFTMDGRVPDGIAPGVPTTSEATMAFTDPDGRSVEVVFNDEAMTVRTAPLAESRVVIAEFHY
jgi:pimeloyl-ACP methyl ester carboxylesterase